MSPQPTSEASCLIEAGSADASSDGGGGDTCIYGDTMFGQDGDDDDCKYHVTWTSTPICESTNVIFTVTLKNLGDNTPVTGIPGGIIIETFIPASLDAACDNIAAMGAPISPSLGKFLVETPAGSGVYTGPVVFSGPGEWTLRFHIHEECADLFPDSPHGHAAFHINVP